jgi:hypothetical protein
MDEFMSYQEYPALAKSALLAMGILKASLYFEEPEFFANRYFRRESWKNK